MRECEELLSQHGENKLDPHHQTAQDKNICHLLHSNDLQNNSCFVYFWEYYNMLDDILRILFFVRCLKPYEQWAVTASVQNILIFVNVYIIVVQCMSSHASVVSLSLSLSLSLLIGEWRCRHLECMYSAFLIKWLIDRLLYSHNNKLTCVCIQVA